MAGGVLSENGEVPQRTAVTGRKVMHEADWCLFGGIIHMSNYNCVRHLEEILFEMSDTDLSTLLPYGIYSSEIITATIIIIITVIFSNN